VLPICEDRFKNICSVSITGKGETYISLQISYQGNVILAQEIDLSSTKTSLVPLKSIQKRKLQPITCDEYSFITQPIDLPPIVNSQFVYALSKKNQTIWLDIFSNKTDCLEGKHQFRSFKGFPLKLTIHEADTLNAAEFLVRQIASDLIVVSAEGERHSGFYQELKFDQSVNRWIPLLKAQLDQP
jgi:hypothetical protein